MTEDSAVDSVDALLGPIRRMFAKLERSDAFERGDADAAIRQLTEASANALGVERASIWRFVDDRSRLECLDLYERTPQRHSAGITIAAGDAPRYFRALAEERSIAAHAARSDPRTN